MKDLLKENHIKVTTPRLAVLEAIKNLDDKSTIKNIIFSCTSIDKSTIYRTIETLIEKNILDKEIVNNEVTYHLKGEHRHYLNCVNCHERVEIKECPFDDEEIQGFKILNHSLNIDGLCKKCQKK